jgi:hypothetical protein
MFRWAIFIFLAQSAESRYPGSVRVGILTSAFDSYWNYNTQSFGSHVDNSDLSQQFREVMILAVDEINLSSTLLPQTSINISFVGDSLQTYGDVAADAAYLAHQAFGYNGSDVILGPFSSRAADVSALALKKYSKASLSPEAISTKLSSKSDAPFFARLAPSLSLQARAIADLMISDPHDWYVSYFYPHNSLLLHHIRRRSSMHQ